MNDRLHSYPHIRALGHPEIEGLFNGLVAVQEKVDGSQFTAAVADVLPHQHLPVLAPARMKAIPEDVEAECAHEIKEALYAHFWPVIRKGVCNGVPAWYKDRLAESAFAEQAQ
jgi:hypothetical protein